MMVAVLFVNSCGCVVIDCGEIAGGSYFVVVLTVLVVPEKNYAVAVAMTLVVSFFVIVCCVF